MSILTDKGHLIVALDPKKYKLTVKPDPEKEIEMTIRIMKVDSKRNCVGFTRKSGDSLEFFNAFGKIRQEVTLLAKIA